MLQKFNHTFSNDLQRKPVNLFPRLFAQSFHLIALYFIQFRLDICISNYHKMKQPKKWKMAILVWLVIYPTISIITILIGPLLTTFPILIRTLIMSLILVPFMIFVAMPFLNKVFKNWLTK
jgi:hypothetical protein